jgi:hypothetical protein
MWKSLALVLVATKTEFGFGAHDQLKFEIA